MGGKTCVITGASSGIGKETALGLAALGARVVMVCRDEGRAENVRSQIRQHTPGAEVDVVLADLFIQGDIRRAAGQINERYARLDVLVNNAGLLIGKRTLTPDGLESTFALNHMGYFLMANLLLEKLKASAPARIVNVSSEAHWRAPWRWENLQGERRYGQFTAYSNSKLANLLFTFELARRLSGTGVTVNAIHPGFVRSRFGTSATPAMRILIKLAGPLGLSSARGADTAIWASTAPELATVTGKYFIARRESRSSAISRDEEVQKKLWELSERLAGTARPA
jgi:NAD(P)-dependent dehydrogenase (short-subunit alcohol dehydrogenase family)